MVYTSMAAKVSSEVSSSSSKLKYDVFLSFRGEDTRKNFTDHLYAALVSAGVCTYRDDDELQRGKHISSELLRAIQDSKISIVVFSKGYASSKWCLNELVKIMECKNTLDHMVIPIFYDVDPSDVRKQTGSYAKAFSEDKVRFVADLEMIERWKAALTEAADLSGWDLQTVANGHESKFIQKIVEDVLGKVNRVYLHVATHPVAIESRREKVMELLRIGSSNVRMVGICGMGGIGKTTIAKAVYNSVFEDHGFDGTTFLSNIKDYSKQPNGLATLQQQLLSDILNLKDMIRIDNVDRGINLIQERLRSKRVFIVLDDVDDSTQLKSLVGDRKWLGVGSKIIVTTRDERLLTETEVEHRYKVEILSSEESILLFSWHAFRSPYPKDDYAQLSKTVVDHVQGLPLALEVLGSFLFKRSHLEWENVVEKLRQTPHESIHKKLRISFDGLDEQSKAIFLHIACFFVGMKKEYVMKILEGCGFFPAIGVSVLVERSLISIGEFDFKLQMHDLLRDMGREIVRETSPNYIGKRTRLWFYEDVINVLSMHTGTKAVEGLSLDVSAAEEDVILSTEAFAKMKNLRLLKINSVRFTAGCFEKFSKELRWLCWHRCPLQVLPPSLSLDNLAVLDMRFSNLKKVWKDAKFLPKLKILDLSYSTYLVETPNFDRLPNLERLQLEGCRSLTKLHPSIGTLERLVLLNLANSNKLRELPESTCNLRSLETLNLNGCSKLSSLPVHLGKLEALRELLANGTVITQLPSSIGLLKNLQHLSLAGCEEETASQCLFSLFSSWVSPKSVGYSTLLPVTISNLILLKDLNLGGLALSNRDISVDFGSFPFLYSLNLEGNKFNTMPVGISNHSCLWYLNLDGCINLESIPELPPNLWRLSAKQCTSMVRYPTMSNIVRSSNIIDLTITNCGRTTDSEFWECDLSPISSSRMSNRWIEAQAQGQFVSKFKYLEAWLPERMLPDWLDFKQKSGSSLSFRMPSVPLDEKRDMVLCVIVGVNEECNSIDNNCNVSAFAASLAIFFKNTTKGCQTFDRACRGISPLTEEICEDHAWVSYMQYTIFEDIMAEEEDEVEVCVEVQGHGRRFLVKKCGVHLPIIAF